MERLGFTYEFLWGCAIAAIPLAVGVSILCMIFRARPAVRHVLWMVVLVSLVSPALLVAIGVPRLPDFAIETGPGDEVGFLPTSGPVGGRVDAPPQLESRTREAVPTIDRQNAVAWSEPSSTSAEVLLLHPSELIGIGLPAELGLGRAYTPDLATRTASRAAQQESQPVEATRSWRGVFVATRRALLSMPAIPRWLWAGGALLFGLVLLHQLNRLRLIVRRAALASWDVQREVERLSEQLGLRRAPEALFVDDCISPMITCGFTPRVLLPRELWGELDDDCRRAVLVHELAHLRRRDHVFCWVETLLGVVYWWHPLVWWVRRNLQEEADLCCDAWVTNLLPRHRRAYAEALVTTREFIGGGGVRPVSCALGMTTPRAKRFSRRLSMVMTRKMSPRTSGTGLALASAALAVGAMLTPTLACPPEEQEKASLALIAGQPVPIAASSSWPEPRTEVKWLATAPEAALLYAQPERRRAAGDLDARLERLEQRIDRLIQQMERGERASRGGGGSVDVAPRFRGNPPPAPTRPQADGDDIQHAYQLPQGKLDNLWELMARDDVPVFVSKGEGNSIVFHGTPAQQRVFKAFCDMISPKGGGGAADIGVADEARMLLDRALRAPRDARDPREDRAGMRGEEARELLNLERRAAEQSRSRAGSRRSDAVNVDRDVQRRNQKNLERRAEQMQGRAEELEELAEEMLEEAEGKKGRASQGLEQKAERIFQEAAVLNLQAEAMLEQAELIEASIEIASDAIEVIWENGSDDADCDDDDADEADCDESDCDEDDDEGSIR